MAKSPKKASVLKEADVPNPEDILGDPKKDWAIAQLRKMHSSGQIDPTDKDANVAALRDLMKQWDDEELARGMHAGAQYQSAMAGVPESEPEPLEAPEVYLPDEPGLVHGKMAARAATDAAEKAKAKRETEKSAIKSAPTPELPSAHKSASPEREVTVDDDKLREVGFRPGWQIEAMVRFSKDTGSPVYGYYFVKNPTWDPSKPGRQPKMIPASDQMNKAMSMKKHPEHGALLALLSLKSDRRYMVSIHRGSRGLIAQAFGPDPDYDKLVAGGVKPKPSIITSGTPQHCQEVAEKAAGVAGETDTGEMKHFQGSAPMTAPEGEKFEPEGGWEEAGQEINDLDLADESKPDSPAVRWGDYWRSKTAQDITDSRVDPRTIDPRMADDPGLTKEQEAALRKLLAKARRMGGRGVDNPPTADNMPASHVAGSHRGFGSDMSGIDKEFDYIDPETGVKKKGITYGWELPPHGSIIHPEIAKHRDHIRFLVPYLQSYLNSMKTFATQSIKPITGDTIGWHQSFDEEGKGEEQPLIVNKEDVDDDAPCGKCKHPAKDHEGWPNAALECQHPECQTEKPTRSGGMMKDSLCQHYVPTKMKTGRTGHKRKQGKLDFDRISSLTKDLVKLPSSWGSKYAGDLPPYFPTQIEKAEKEDPDKALEMQKAVAEWYMKFNPESLSAKGVPLPKPPHSREEVTAAKQKGDEASFKKMYDENMKWWKMMEKKAEDNQTVQSAVYTIYDFAEKARHNLWSTFRENMKKKFEKDLFGRVGDDDSALASIKRKFIDNNVFGETQGIGPDKDFGRQHAWSSQRLVAGQPFSQKLKSLQDIETSNPKTLKTWQSNALKGYKMAQAYRPDMTPQDFERRFDQMRMQYERLSEKMKDHLMLGEAITTYLRRLANKLKHSGGWGMGADKEVYERSGPNIRNLGMDYDDQKKNVKAKFPTIRSKAEMDAAKTSEAEKEASAAKARADAIAAKKIDPKSVKPAAKRPGIPTTKVPGQLGHVTGVPLNPEAWDESMDPSLDLPAEIHAQDEEADEWNAEQRAAWEAEMRSMGQDPDALWDEVYGQSREGGGKRMDESLDHLFEHVSELATGDVKPKWYDEL